MLQTTLCYIKENNKTLMLYRNKKKNDLNEGKWIGIGGKFEENESPYDCIRRESKEEIGRIPKRLRYCGIITFISDQWENEQMHLFEGSDLDGEIDPNCSEGELHWLSPEEFSQLPQWEGDKLFLDLMNKGLPFFSLKLVYHGDCLISAQLNGTDLSL